MAAIESALRTALPTRVISRTLIDFADRPRPELREGVLTLLCRGERDYANTIGREAQLGTIDLSIVGQVEIDEKQPAEAVEQAELALYEELRAFCVTRTAATANLLLRSVQFSGQLERPYGWFLAEAEVLHV